MFQNYFDVLIILPLIQTLGPNGLLARDGAARLSYVLITSNFKSEITAFLLPGFDTSMSVFVTRNFLGHFRGCWHSKRTEKLTAIAAFCKYKEDNEAVRPQHLP